MASIQKECDYLVIGGGSGGLASAKRASRLYGATVILVENKRLGGTCVNVGCVPKKITWNAAATREILKGASHYGFSVNEDAPFDWAAFTQKRADYVKRLNEIHESNLNNEGVEYLAGRAKFTAKDTVEVSMDDGSIATVKGKHILIAVGGRPIVPRNQGAEGGITSDGFFELGKQPKVAAIVGAGYIAVEMAGMLQSLGTETHLFIRHDTFLRSFDPMIQQILLEEYRRQGIKIHKSSKLTKIEQHLSEEEGSTIYYEDADSPNGASLDVEILLWAVGRTPETDALGLEAAGVTTNEKGVIQTDEFENTNVKGIYAIGDVVGKVELTPVAIAAGRRLADRVFGGKSGHKLSYENVPSVVFAHPEAGTIGLTEPQAREKYGDGSVKIYETSFTNLYYVLLPEEERSPTRYKLVCAGKDERVVGLHIVGRDSGEILQGFGVAIKMGATKADFDNCVAIHPTSAEELVTLK